MIYLVVGKNGSGKSYYIVSKIKEFEDQNIKTLASNSDIVSKNLEILRDRDLPTLLENFSSTLEKLRVDNPKVYAIFDTPEQLNANFYNFTLIEDGVDFLDYFRYHIIYNDFLKYLFIEHELKLEVLKPVHQLRSDINGLKIKTCTLPDDDWRKEPLGSKIFYDEFQDRPEYLWEGNKPSKEPMIIELSKIRHYDIDLYLLTPDSDNLHKSLRKIVHVLYFVKRPHGNPQCCSVYTFDQFLSNPRSAADSTREPKKYASHELVKYQKSIQRLYVSAANHSSMKFQIPWKWIRNAVFIILGFSIILAMLFKIPIFSYFAQAIKGMFGEKTAVSGALTPEMKNMPGQKQEPTMQQTTQISPELKVKIDQCVKQFGWSPEMCREGLDKEYLESKNKQLEQKTGNSMERIIVDYNPNKPFEAVVTGSYQVTAMPVFSGCMKKNGKYIAYTQQGTILHDVSENDCRKVIDDGDRPFNYFAQAQPSKSGRSAHELTQPNTETPSL